MPHKIHILSMLSVLTEVASLFNKQFTEELRSAKEGPLLTSLHNIGEKTHCRQNHFQIRFPMHYTKDRPKIPNQE